jgi:predicted NBD/HSP70 family sugar kinase
MDSVRTPARPADREAAPGHSPNLAEALQMIWRERRISRAEIARRTGLSRSTVSSIVSDLLQTQLVAEVGAGESHGGRRPIVLEFQDDTFRILGIDLGASHISVALTDLRGRVLHWADRAHPVRTDPRGAQAMVLQLADRCLERARCPRDRLIGVGLAVPSPIDPLNPDQLSALVLPAWRGHSVTGPLAERYGVPVLVDNDANLGALAEQWWGAARDVTDSAYIKVATGVGSGHIIGGRIYRGATGTAGEIGHIAIDPLGPPCLCGLRGCLVTLVGTQALVARATELTSLRRTKSMLSQSKTLTITAIEDAALAGDALALEVVRDAAHHLGIAVAGMLNLMNPALVSIGGSLARLGALLIDPLRDSVRTRTLVSSVVASRIVASELGERDVAMGAATLVLQSALADLRFFPTSAGRA